MTKRAKRWNTNLERCHPAMYYFFKRWHRNLGNRWTRALKRLDFDALHNLDEAREELWRLVGQVHNW